MSSSLLLLVLGCVVSSPKDPTGEPTAGTPGGTPTTSPTGTTPTTEPPAACELASEPEGTVPIDPACEGVPEPADPWSVRLEHRLLAAYPRATPVVGDMDADGLPEIAVVDRFAGSFGARLVVYEGDGSVKFEHPYGHEPDVDPLIADLDGDGAAELVLVRDETGIPELVALDAAGEEIWKVSPLSFECLWDLEYCATSAADVDGDGAVEVLIDGYVVDGATGAVEQSYVPDDTGLVLRGLFAADLDRDGRAEIVHGERVYAGDGTLVYAVPREGARSAFSAPVQLDGDEAGELAVSLDRRLALVDTDGTVLEVVDVPGATEDGWAGPPCVGDLDGDGASEIVVPGGATIDVFEQDGSVAWSAPMSGNDGTGLNAGALGCAVFDFDADGADDIAFGDVFSLRILDGRTGETRWETPEYGGYTMLQGPVVADIDVDGAAELLASSTGHLLNGSDWMGLQVYESRGGWPATRPLWGTGDYAVANQGDDGAPLLPAVPSWVSPGIFRGQDVPTAKADLAVELVDLCLACGDDLGRVAVTVANGGATEAADPMLDLVAVDGGGDRRVLDTVELDAIAPGARLASVELTWRPSKVDPDETLRIEVRGAADCDPTDDALALTETCE